MWECWLIYDPEGKSKVWCYSRARGHDTSIANAWMRNILQAVRVSVAMYGCTLRLLWRGKGTCTSFSNVAWYAHTRIGSRSSSGNGSAAAVTFHLATKRAAAADAFAG